MMIIQYKHTQYHSSASIKMAEMVSFTLHMFCHIYKTDKETKRRCFHPTSFLLKSAGCDLSGSQASLLTCCNKLLSQVTGLLCSLLYLPLKCCESPKAGCLFRLGLAVPKQKVAAWLCVTVRLNGCVDSGSSYGFWKLASVWMLRAIL